MWCIENAFANENHYYKERKNAIKKLETLLNHYYSYNIEDMYDSREEFLRDPEGEYWLDRICLFEVKTND